MAHSEDYDRSDFASDAEYNEAMETLEFWRAIDRKIEIQEEARRVVDMLNW